MNPRLAMPIGSMLAGLLAGLALSPAIAAAADSPAPPPSAEQIKACVQQIDSSKRWTFDWKTVEVGQPRKPQNNYEAANLAGVGQPTAAYGYPVHVVYNFGGLQTIDRTYWLIQNAQGKWQIPLICTIP